MTDVPRDLIMGSAPSMTGFHTTDVGVAASRAIEKHAAAIIRAADAGEPPVAVLIEDLDHLICEGMYWRMVERMITTRLGPDYEKASSKPVPIACHRRGRSYRRVSEPASSAGVATPPA
jgi:hypothetical protein